MRFYIVLRHMGMLLLILGLAMALCAAFGVWYGGGGARPLAWAGAITSLVAIFPLLFVSGRTPFDDHEAYGIVVFGWLAVCLFGMLPYLFWEGEFDWSKAWFESVSGFTTTGATMLSDVESLPPALQLWRSLTHWFGGVGVVAFALLMFRRGGLRAQMLLARVEISSVARHDDLFRSWQMMRIMMLTYALITLLIIGGLRLTGVALFEAVNLAFSAVATGGFAVRNDSITSLGGWTQLVLILGMLLSSLHMGLTYRTVVIPKSHALWNSWAVRVFIAIVVVATALIGLDLWLRGLATGPSEAVRRSAFMVSSYISTTGFGIEDVNLWPSSSLFILFMLSLIGGCSGSTAGAIKVDRMVQIFAGIRAYLQQLRHPHARPIPHVGALRIPNKSVMAACFFALIYMAVLFIHSTWMALWGCDMVTAFSYSASAMANLGIGMGSIGTLDSLASFPVPIHVTLPIVMLIGRLEIFGILLVLGFGED